VSATEVKISPEAEQLHRSSIVIDGLSFYYDGPSDRLNPDRVTATNVTTVETYNGFIEAIDELTNLRELAFSDPGVIIVERASDIEKAKAEGKIGLILGFQSSLPIENRLDRVRVFHDMGIRIIQPTYNDRDYAGDGCLEPVDGGLSRFGRRLIEEFARVGILLDLSHAGRRTALEAAEASPGPLSVTHAAPLNLTDSVRNLTDELMKKVAEKDGVVGMCCWGPLIWKNQPQRPTIDDFIDHIDYACELIGPKHVGIATDSPCTTNVEWTRRHSEEFDEAFPEIASEYRAKVGKDKMHPEGLPGIADLRPVTDGLLRRGYSESDVKGIIGGNFLRLFEQVWK
jgi:membrane dipeptidase